MISGADGAKANSATFSCGRPSFEAVHVCPESSLRKTPRCVAIRMVWLSWGFSSMSLTMASAGSCPAETSRHVSPVSGGTVNRPGSAFFPTRSANASVDAVGAIRGKGDRCDRRREIVLLQRRETVANPLPGLALIRAAMDAAFRTREDDTVILGMHGHGFKEVIDQAGIANLVVPTGI